MTKLANADNIAKIGQNNWKAAVNNIIWWIDQNIGQKSN